MERCRWRGVKRTTRKKVERRSAGSAERRYVERRDKRKENKYWRGRGKRDAGGRERGQTGREREREGRQAGRQAR